jgi:hypothetical protein
MALTLLNTLLTLCTSLGPATPDSTAKAPPLKLSGSADVYYRYDLLNPQEAPYNNRTSFTNSHNSFELGMVSLKAEHSFHKVGIVADLGFGRRAAEFSYLDNAGTLAIKQLYVTYAPTAKLKLTAGSWATHIGYEVVDAYANRNYSMSYMFSYGPFFHTGVKAEVGLGELSTLMVGIANTTDYKTGVGMPKMEIAQLATGSKDGKLKAYLNYQGGKATDSLRLHQADVVLTYAVSSKLSLSYNGTAQSRQQMCTEVERAYVQKKWRSAQTWWGSAVYLNYDPTSWLGFTCRGEYLQDKNTVLGLDRHLFEATLSSNIRIDNLTIIPEIRLDGSPNNRPFARGSIGQVRKTTETLLLAATYHF